MSAPVRGPLGLPKLEGPERQEALSEPGASWREWFYRSFLKTWILLAYLVVDSWIATTFLSPFNAPGLVGGLAAALYLELLAYRYLWYRPDTSVERPYTPFQPTWLRLTRFGRWTPEAERVRHGLEPMPDVAGPDPREFL